MTREEHFYSLHGELIKFYQIIENDIKWIYSFMLEGNPNKTRMNVSNYTLGQILNELKRLDNSDDNPCISPADYKFLNKMTDKRNYWCHQCYIDFVYEDNCFKSKEFNTVYDKLIKDYSQASQVVQNVQELKLKLRR